MAQVVLIIDNAPWHRGRPVDWALRRFPHLSLYRLPPYSPQLQPIERLWRPLRQRATHNLLFDEMTELQQACARAWATSGHGPTSSSSSSARLGQRPDYPRRESGSGQRLAWTTWASSCPFALDVFACLRCGGRRRVLAYVKGAGGVRAILKHLGLPTAGAHLAHARGPPQSAWC
ncbi:transposase [Corallococcus aberystwythensis]|uniref:transposase n=1 Tax=Corallococcus aberystwythensis TaxID=2316722 RepID=UPI001ABFDF9D